MKKPALLRRLIALAQYAKERNPSVKAELGTDILAALRRKRFPAQNGSVTILPRGLAADAVADVTNRARWYLAGTGATVFVGPKGFPERLVPEGQLRFVDTDLSVQPYSKTGDAAAWWDMKGQRIELLWRKNAYVLDPAFHGYLQSKEWFRLRASFRSTERLEEQFAQSRMVLETWLEETKSRTEAFLFATGPSLDAAWKRKYPEDSVRVVCNSIVKNQKLLEHIRPNLLVFSDDVFHFGPSEYAARFRSDAVKTVEAYPECRLAVPDYALDLMLTHYPTLKNRTIGVSFTPERTWKAPTPNAPSVPATGNILTQFMMPFVAMPGRTVRIVGADGRNPDETYFWRHSGNNQYDDLMWTVKKCHPSFFSENNYRDYYDEHCSLLKSQVEWLEQMGCSVRALTKSFIPALAERPDADQILP